MKNLKSKLLTLAVLATILMTSTPTFAATNTSTSNAVITKTIATSNTTVASKLITKPGTITPQFNCGRVVDQMLILLYIMVGLYNWGM